MFVKKVLLEMHRRLDGTSKFLSTIRPKIFGTGAIGDATARIEINSIKFSYFCFTLLTIANK